MEFLISAATDIGLTKNTNQDSFLARRFRTKLGNMTFAVLCDGMGGLSKGEVAAHPLSMLLRNGLIRDFPNSARRDLMRIFSGQSGMT